MTNNLCVNFISGLAVLFIHPYVNNHWCQFYIWTESNNHLCSVLYLDWQFYTRKCVYSHVCAYVLIIIAFLIMSSSMCGKE